MWNSILAGIVFDHHSIESLRRELSRSLSLAQACGFNIFHGDAAIPLTAKRFPVLPGARAPRKLNSLKTIERLETIKNPAEIPAARVWIREAYDSRIEEDEYPSHPRTDPDADFCGWKDR